MSDPRLPPNASSAYRPRRGLWYAVDVPRSHAQGTVTHQIAHCCRVGSAFDLRVCGLAWQARNIRVERLGRHADRATRPHAPKLARGDWALANLSDGSTRPYRVSGASRDQVTNCDSSLRLEPSFRAHRQPPEAQRPVPLRSGCYVSNDAAPVCSLRTRSMSPQGGAASITTG
jgi:hypothetical protein